MATEAVTVNVGKLSAIKCSIRSTTVPEKTRHIKYAPEALTAVVEHYNAHQAQQLDIAACRASYVHGSIRAFIFEVPEDHVGDIILGVQTDVHIRDTPEAHEWVTAMLNEIPTILSHIPDDVKAALDDSMRPLFSCCLCLY